MVDDPIRIKPLKKWRTLGLLALAELLAMAVWFSASAVVSALTSEWQLTPSEQAWLTMSVQIGFVVGAGALALLNLADRIPARRFFTLLALCAALSTALIPALAGGLEATLLLRFLSGFFLTGVYPTGMKIMATWTQKERGLGIGLLVGALTLVHDPLDPHACSVGRLGMGLCLSGARPVGGYRGYVDVAARAHRHTSGWWQKIKTGIKLVRWLDQKVDR